MFQLIESGFTIGLPALSISASNFEKMHFGRTQHSSGDVSFDGSKTKAYEYKPKARLFSVKTGRTVYVQVDNLRPNHSRVLVSLEAALALGVVVNVDTIQQLQRKCQVAEQGKRQAERFIKKQASQIEALHILVKKSQVLRRNKLCIATCRSGEPCKYPRKYGNYCGKHKKGGRK